MNLSSSNEWPALFGAALDGSIDEDGARRLNELLRSNEEARRQWYLHCDVELGLADWGASSFSKRSGSSPLDPIDEAPPSAPRPHRWRRAAAILLPVAAAIVVGLFLVKGSDPREPVVIDILKADGIEPGWHAGVQVPVREIRLQTGELTFSPSPGITVTATAPVALEVLGPEHLRVEHGKVTAEATPGFLIQTKHADFVDLGTEFGVEVVPGSDTRLVVFDGEVEVHRPDRREREPLVTVSRGRGLKIGSEGRIAPLPALVLGPATSRWSTDTPSDEEAVIRRVSDNTSTDPVSQYYPLYPGGFAEGVRAFPYKNNTPRWWSTEPGTLPAWLHGADFVKTLQRELGNRSLEISVEIIRPCTLFVFHESESAPPDWLVEDFEGTGTQLVLSPEPPPAELPGDRSVQPLRIYDVWSRRIDKPGIVQLGPAPRTSDTAPPHYMYGIAAKAMPAALPE